MPLNDKNIFERQQYSNNKNRVTNTMAHHSINCIRNIFCTENLSNAKSPFAEVFYTLKIRHIVFCFYLVGLIIVS